ncbi:AT-rich interactive domain-containing protein 4-like [Impatiens glandulifera]|uniref:AT-rich interactive domain-containing protein 4-like n=1 Tax=Impatiens glandulifera TaxID=253017 RepID=UPI001FB18DF4|nr:AT-rich interactive domain-containing protein 4-like [Impatiens glandulifera]XP_047337677.1 AT-rich interactive domain-containing protein 4-like [Impatiens glandulifera]XP_047337678.1 AT-rich interactive domain-containing protein 4-like [Impatiens glandulifera]
MQGASRNSCSLLVVLCGKVSEDDKKLDVDSRLSYPFPEITSFGRLEIQTLTSPSIEDFRKALDAFQPNFVYLQGEQRSNNEVGPLSWSGVDFSSEEMVAGLFDTSTPTTVYLEIPEGEKLAEAIEAKGVPYVIYWNSDFSRFAACHFRHALLSVIQSSSSHTWDAFHVAEASFRLYCAKNSLVLPFNNQKAEGKLGPSLLGEPPKIDVPLPEIGEEDEEEGSSDDHLAIKIYDDHVNIRLLVCGEPSILDDGCLGALEDGLNALLRIEMRGSKLHSRVSALPPPLQAPTFSRSVMTMRCDITTASAAHISLLVSGSAQTCFDDQLMENHIKSEVIEKSQLAHLLPEGEKDKMFHSHPRKSDAIACGATIFEVGMKVPTWASQVLSQLAPDVSYRSLVALGIAGVQGIAVAPFEKHDANRLLFFCSRQGKDPNPSNSLPKDVPNWLRPPPPNINRFAKCKMSPSPCNGIQSDNGTGLPNGTSIHLTPLCNKSNVAAMRPIPHVRHQKMLPFSTTFEVNGYDGSQINPSMAIVPSLKHGLAGSTPISHRKLQSGSSQTNKQHFVPLNPLPLKKHGCGRSPIHVCTEEEFLKDVMQFLILRGHNRLIPQGGLAEFPDAILNAKRLDLFNLYREVVSRGGFHVGNGINWKGQVFSKMSNHTVTNRMTGVGNTLKRHYETYLLEYELAHEDVDGECCLLCHSSAAGDWVNCGICGEWAHFGCDRRQGLGAFKDYAKTDGLEYICPQCSISNFKKKVAKTSNGYS